MWYVKIVLIVFGISILSGGSQFEMIETQASDVQLNTEVTSVEEQSTHNIEMESVKSVS